MTGWTGWTIDEAIRRSVDAPLVQDWERARNALAAQPRPGRRLLSVPNWAEPELHEQVGRGRERGRQFTRARQARDAAWHAVTFALVSHLKTRKLLAVGSCARPTAPPAVLPHTAWERLKIAASGSILTERTPEKTTIYGVRFYPLLEAPCRYEVLEALGGMALAEAIREFVLDDPEVTRLAREASARIPTFAPTLVRSAQSQGPVLWPLASSSVAGACAIGSRELAEAGEARKVLERRLAALRDLLLCGDLVGHGDPARPGLEREIPRAIWSHASHQLDPCRGDVWCIDSADGAARELCWRDVKLARAAFHVKPPAHDPVRGSTTACDETALPRRSRRAPKAERVAAALAKAGLAGSPGDLSHKQVAARIANHMAAPPRTESEHAALTKTVARYYASRRSA